MGILIYKAWYSLVYMSGDRECVVCFDCDEIFMKKINHNMRYYLSYASYRIPDLKSVGIFCFDRAKIFLKRVGGIIFALSILLWFYVRSHKRQRVRHKPAIDYSFAGMLGSLDTTNFGPNWF